MSGKPNSPLYERFWSKAQADDSGCWLWTASKNNMGYGQFGVKTGDGMRKSHRVAWELSRGPVPDGQCVLHRCDRPACVNPDHLFLGTKRENTLDMFAKKRDGMRLARALTVAQVADIRRRAGSGETQASICADFSMARGSITKIVNRRTYKDV